VVLTVIFCLAAVVYAQLLPNYKVFEVWHLGLLIVCLIILFPLHEVIHAIGLVIFAGVSRSNIKFGVLWYAMAPYCHCKVPIRVAAYRRMALLPLWITGGASLVALLIYPTDVLGLFAGVTIAGCVGDVWLVVKVRRFADDLWIQDSPTEIGCDVLSSSA
jgi:hypothetical protein